MGFGASQTSFTQIVGNRQIETSNPIDENTARLAKQMNSYGDYVQGSATAEYRAMVDKAAAIAKAQKAKVDPLHHEKIDRLLDTYARKLAENLNESYRIQTRCPSILVAGPSNFPVRKKEKQNAANARNMDAFRWAPSQGVWQRMLNQNGINAARQITEAWMPVESE